MAPKGAILFIYNNQNYKVELKKEKNNIMSLILDVINDSERRIKKTRPLKCEDYFNQNKL